MSMTTYTYGVSTYGCYIPADTIARMLAIFERRITEEHQSRGLTVEFEVVDLGEVRGKVKLIHTSMKDSRLFHQLVSSYRSFLVERHSDKIFVHDELPRVIPHKYSNQARDYSFLG